ncbi:MAG: hypothetical protein M3N45_09525 [Actinomycetota bacterium]|nr:hypothetical protein [Actinomycetota bacterium]
MGADERGASPVELITGANRGIGFEVCPQVARGYSRVVLAAWFEEKIGTLDVLVNNPAAYVDWSETMLTPDLHTAHEVLDTNLFGAWRASQTFLSLIRRSTSGTDE